MQRIIALMTIGELFPSSYHHDVVSVWGQANSGSPSFDLRPFLYPYLTWPFSKIDQTVKEIEKREQEKREAEKKKTV